MFLNLRRMTKSNKVIYSEKVVIGVILILIKHVLRTNLKWKLLHKLKAVLSFAKSGSLFVVRYSTIFQRTISFWVKTFAIEIKVPIEYKNVY